MAMGYYERGDFVFGAILGFALALALMSLPSLFALLNRSTVDPDVTAAEAPRPPSHRTSSPCYRELLRFPTLVFITVIGFIHSAVSAKPHYSNHTAPTMCGHVMPCARHSTLSRPETPTSSAVHARFTSPGAPPGAAPESPLCHLNQRLASTHEPHAAPILRVSTTPPTNHSFLLAVLLAPLHFSKHMVSAICGHIMSSVCRPASFAFGLIYSAVSAKPHFIKHTAPAVCGNVMPCARHSTPPRPETPTSTAVHVRFTSPGAPPGAAPESPLCHLNQRLASTHEPHAAPILRVSTTPPPPKDELAKRLKKMNKNKADKARKKAKASRLRSICDSDGASL